MSQNNPLLHNDSYFCLDNNNNKKYGSLMYGFLHLHVKLLIKNHESFNLKIYANGCFVVSVK